MKAYQLHKNFIILKENQLVNLWWKIYLLVFWLDIPNHRLVSIIMPETMIIDSNVIWGRIHPWNFCHNYGTVVVLIKVDLNTNFSFSWSIPMLSIFSLIILFKGSKYLKEQDNSTYPECKVERLIFVYIFETHNRCVMWKKYNLLVEADNFYHLLGLILCNTKHPQFNRLKIQHWKSTV